MERKDVLAYLSLLKIPEDKIHIYGDNALQISCPLASRFHHKKTDDNPSCCIKFGKAKPTTFFCFSCRQGGKLADLLDSYGRIFNDETIIKLAEKLSVTDEIGLIALMESAGCVADNWFRALPKNELSVYVSKERYNDRFLLASKVQLARKYLAHRGIHEELWDKFDLRFDPMEERLVFPVYDRANNLVGAVGRAIYAKYANMKYKNYYGFQSGHSLGGLNHVDEKFNCIIVVEGFFCILRAFEWVREKQANITCTFMASTSDHQASQLAALGQSIQCWYDHDEAGNIGWNGNGRNYRGIRSMLTGKIPSLKRAYFQQNLDVAQMTRKQFDETYDRTREYTTLFRKELYV